MQRDEFVHSSFQASGTSVSRIGIWQKSETPAFSITILLAIFSPFLLGISRKYSLDF